ncbi:MAG: hypothetical protein V4558_10510 [Gemmatimonadota bacterium]
MEVPTTEDIKADAKRAFRWSTLLPSTLWVLATFQAIARLKHPELVGTGRLFWALLPLPLMVWAFWAWEKAEKRNSEFERVVNLQATTYAYRLTVFWLFGVVLLNAAVGFPIEVWTPIPGLRDTIGWTELIMLPPLFFSFIGYMVVHRRVFPKK